MPFYRYPGRYTGGQRKRPRNSFRSLQIVNVAHLDKKLGFLGLLNFGPDFGGGSGRDLSFGTLIIGFMGVVWASKSYLLFVINSYLIRNSWDWKFAKWEENNPCGNF